MTAPQRTSGQVTAANPTASVWVSANAGTGKTQVLTDRIMRLLLSGSRPERILCLTFTKAAAAEMTTRLSKRLGEWAAADDDTLKAELTALEGFVPDDNRLAVARRLFAQTLDAPGGMNVRTIHAFCESLLGRFPVEAGVAPHFSVIDERTTAELISEARDRMLARTFIDRDSAVSHALSVLAGLLDEESFSWTMSDLSGKRGRLANLLDYHGSLENLILASGRSLGLEPDDDRTSIISSACDETAFDAPGLEQAATALDLGTAKDMERAGILRTWLKDSPSRQQFLFSDYFLLFLKIDGGKRSEKTLITKKPRESDPKALDILLTEQERVFRIRERLKAVAVFEASAALIHLGTAMMGDFASLKESRALLDYDDLILKAGGLLDSEQGTSWVHYKLDGGLDHILVDEAQDTAPDQWRVIKSLANDFFSGIGAGEQERTVFAVGDEKQSIYSFQGADPFMFGATQKHFHDAASHADKTFTDVQLALSYRSTAPIIQAVDMVFSGNAARDGLTFDGRDIRHLTNRQGQGGLVEIWPTMTPGDVLEVSPWKAPLDRLPVDSPEDRLSQRIADTIGAWLTEGEILPSACRPIRESDIMILVRNRGSFAEKMVNALKKRSIAVAGADRMILTEQLAVMDLMALGHFLLLPEDSLTLAVVLKSPLFGMDEDDLFNLAHKRSGTLWESLKKAAETDPKLRVVRDRLGELLDRADTMPPYEFYARLLGPEGGRRALLSRLGLEADDPIDEFMALALDFERERAPSLQGFLQWMLAGATQVKRDLEHGRGEVRVMTVHGSKGLQGNIVFLPDTCSTPNARKASRLRWPDAPEPALLWPALKENEESITGALSEDAKNLDDQEYRRLLYVAMTRARDRLYIAGWEGRNGRTENCWYDLVKSALSESCRESLSILGHPVLHMTEPQAAEPDSADRKERVTPVEALQLPDWAHVQPKPEPEPARPLSPTRPEEDAPPILSPYDGDDGIRFKRGTLIHRLLESLPELPADKQPEAAKAFLARKVHELNEAEQNNIASEVMSVLQDSNFRHLFQPGSMAEVPITGTLGSHTVSARIDRLWIGKDSIAIIDYKTNRPPPERPQDIAPSYLSQMAIYRSLLREIYPGHTVSCILAWTAGPNLMTVPDNLLDAHAPIYKSAS